MEDTSFLKEQEARKRIFEIYTKEESDFETPRSYNDYLEHREDVIFALASGQNVQEVEDQIAQYKAENQETIQRHKRRRHAANASFASSLDKLVMEVPQLDVPDRKGVRGSQPIPVESGHEMTEEGTLKVKRQPRTASEWHVMAHAAGWMRRDYYDFVRKHALERVCGS